MERKGETIEFRIERSIAVLGEGKGGWTTELNLVGWNGREAKLDIRPWDPSHRLMGKGLTFTREEALRLRDALTSFLGEA